MVLAFQWQCGICNIVMKPLLQAVAIAGDRSGFDASIDGLVRYMHVAVRLANPLSAYELVRQQQLSCLAQ